MIIDLKRNTKKIPVPASGLRVKKNSIYEPNQLNDFKISRGKFSDYLTCQRCFYMDRVAGLDTPKTPGWSLNTTTDYLLKKEFDYCRKLQRSAQGRRHTERCCQEEFGAQDESRY